MEAIWNDIVTADLAVSVHRSSDEGLIACLTLNLGALFLGRRFSNASLQLISDYLVCLWSDAGVPQELYHALLFPWHGLYHRF